MPLSDTQKGLVGDRDRPQGLTRFGSIVAAGTAPFETRLVTWTCCASAGAAMNPRRQAEKMEAPFRTRDVVD